MATIRMRKRQDRSFAYQAVIRIKQQGEIVYRESKVFSKHQSAKNWAKHREVELQNPEELARARASRKTLAELIRWYIDKFSEISGWQRSKQDTLEFLEKHTIGQEDAYTLSAGRLVRHVRSRRDDGAGPTTVGIDLTYIGVVLETARVAGPFPVDPDVVEAARKACRRLGLIGPPNRREVRPTDQQLLSLTDHFLNRSPRAIIPMADIMWFAVYSARREDEICRIRWADNDPKTRTGLVRDLKHPDRKEGNHRRFRYTQEAWEILQRQPRTSEFIFPYKAASIKEAFRRACDDLHIDDLHFHDLRHEATSRLFERGYEIHEVQQFTLHATWQQLKRYTHLRPEQIKELPAQAAADDQGFKSEGNAEQSEEPRSIADAADRSAQRDRPRSRAKATSGPRA
jgi:integrase